MFKLLLRIFLIAVCIFLLVYSFTGEGYDVFSFQDDKPENVKGDKFVKTLEDGMLMRTGKGKLYNADSLFPDAAQANDCPT